MKKLIAGVLLSSSLLVGVGAAYASSLNGISINKVSIKTNQLAVKNDDAFPVTVTITPERGDYGTEYLSTTLTLQPEEKVYIYAGELGSVYKVHTIGHAYKHDVDLGTFNY